MKIRYAITSDTIYEVEITEEEFEERFDRSLDKVANHFSLDGKEIDSDYWIMRSEIVEDEIDTCINNLSSEQEKALYEKLKKKLNK